MYESLKEFSNIIVSGPQRSGTRIAAKIIAADTDKEYVDEKYINFHDFRLLEWYLDKGNTVVQCPGLSHLLHLISVPSTLVLMVTRPINEILASESRSWSEKSREIELIKYGYTGGIISEIKYDFWFKYQKQRLMNAREVKYHNLEQHPLFIKDRKTFRWDQTE